MNEKRKFTSIIGGDKIVLIVAIIAVFALFTSLNRNFLTPQNMVNLLVASSLVGMVAIGHTYLIIGLQNDLSPGSLAAFCGVLVAILLNKGLPIPVAMVITLAAGAAVGLFNSWMVNQIRIEAFIATLVSQTIIRGFAYIICGGKPVAITNQAFNKLGTFRIVGLPVPVWVMILCIVLFGFILARTRFGRSVYA
ncbi:MAG TPA: ABC transporter permease, partial [Lachnospiraceae bacterium]|nr:ABC transporter permease [Lachnospiraceae bacterium]